MSFYLEQIVRISHRQTGRDTERNRDREKKDREKETDNRKGK